ncbi:MAG: transcription termination factor NusA [Planctomycetales bacterium]|nr:transcription termination factor NusA [Planctomycetales bacterium]
MNPSELLRLVDSLHREKNIDSEIVFSAIESALQTAIRKQRGEEAEIEVAIDRDSGNITAVCEGEELDQAEIGRIGAQTAKQVIIQKIKEAERDSLMDEFHDQVGHLVTGTVQRSERGVTTVQLGNMEAILPRGEQISGESYHNGDRIRAVVYEVKAAGNRVKVILSRTKPQLVQRLFEQEIPEIAEGVIQIRAISREPGHRSKVAVSSSDQRVDCVGACVGVRGNRIKNITSELAGERIDIVRWTDDPETLIPSSLQPAEVEQVLLCDMIGRAIVLVKDDQLSQAIGKYGQNVRLASKLVGWDIEIMTSSELEEQIDRAVSAFMELEGMTDDLAQRLVEQGYLSYDDLSVVEPDALMEMGGMTAEQVDAIVEQADVRAEEAERIAAEQKRLKKELAIAQAANPQAAVEPPPAPVEVPPEASASQDAAAEAVPAEGTIPAEGTTTAEDTTAAESTADKAIENTAEMPDSAEGQDVAAAESHSPEDDRSPSAESIAQAKPNESPDEPAEVTSPAADAPEETMDQTNVADRK